MENHCCVPGHLYSSLTLLFILATPTLINSLIGIVKQSCHWQPDTSHLGQHTAEYWKVKIGIKGERETNNSLNRCFSSCSLMETDMLIINMYFQEHYIFFEKSG